jgi:hypothetical protein
MHGKHLLYKLQLLCFGLIHHNISRTPVLSADAGIAAIDAATPRSRRNKATEGRDDVSNNRNIAILTTNFTQKFINKNRSPLKSNS